MQKHKMFLDTLAVLRRDWKTHPEMIAPVRGKTAQDFLSAYRSYMQFDNATKGFYSTLKLAEGQDHSLDAFFDAINHLMDARQQRQQSPTSGSAPSPSQHL